MATPTPAPRRTDIAALDVPLEVLEAQTSGTPPCEWRHLMDAQDTAYVHCATDHPELIPSAEDGGTS
ncbi:hypothetical protein AB0F42_24270 [Streptomyces buecherae]|uniref:hypothetical protein n=1 Tax=Streptomyces buecherae TaxID=2763006 RepID=UPI0033C34E88